MSQEQTFEALVLCHGNALLRARGWPENAEVAMDARPGWVSVYARFNSDELAGLLTTISESTEIPLWQRQALNRAACNLQGTDATLTLWRDSLNAPELPGAGLNIKFPFAGEWLTDLEYSAVLENIKRSVREICAQVLEDSRQILAAITPLPAPRLFTRETRNFRLIAEECDSESWLDADEPESVKRVLDAILNERGRYCAVRLLMVHELTENILSYAVMHDVIRRPGEPPRRWIEREVVREVIALARTEVLSILNAHQSFDNKR
jgi:hypothetical protein